MFPAADPFTMAGFASANKGTCIAVYESAFICRASKRRHQEGDSGRAALVLVFRYVTGDHFHGKVTGEDVILQKGYRGMV